MRLLPFIEQQGLREKYDTSVTWSHANNLPVSSLRLNTYECPSAPKQNYTMDHEPDGFQGGSTAWTGIVAVGDYGVSLGVSPALGALSTPASPIDASTTQASGGSAITNGFPPKNSQLTFADIHDGTTGFPAPYGTEGSSQPYGFHASGLNALFGDGRVKFLSEDTGIAVVAALVTRNSAKKEVNVSQNF